MRPSTAAYTSPHFHSAIRFAATAWAQYTSCLQRTMWLLESDGDVLQSKPRNRRTLSPTSWTLNADYSSSSRQAIVAPAGEEISVRQDEDRNR